MRVGRSILGMYKGPGQVRIALRWLKRVFWKEKARHEVGELSGARTWGAQTSP